MVIRFMNGATIFFKNLCKHVGDFCFQTSFVVYFGVLYIYKKRCEEMRQIFPKFELFSLLIYFKMKKKNKVN